MGASPTRTDSLVAASMFSTKTAEVSVEEADDGPDRVFVEGTMYHDGLNANAWGLTESGATAIADSLIGRDYTAAHPPLRGNRYDRSIDAGQGAPIGIVRNAHVTQLDTATLDGGEYTASYRAEVLDPTFKDRLTAGLATGDGYGVSIGIYADPEDAICSVCRGEMAADGCDHSRGETVEADDGETQVAGPLYPDGEADHLAHVWRPAYEGATADVDAAAASEGDRDAVVVPEAARVLAEPFDADTSEDDESDEASESPADGDVRLSDDPVERGSYSVRLTHE